MRQGIGTAAVAAETKDRSAAGIPTGATPPPPWPDWHAPKAGGMLTPMSAAQDRSADDWITQLRRRLGHPLPGWEGMMDIAPSARPFIDADAARARGSREGGALLLVYPWRGAPHTVLTLRSVGLRDHAGQISLPGGRIEAGESPADAALREAWEELAVPPAGLDVLGALTPVYIPPSHFLVHPIVAARRTRPDFRPQATEVAEAIEVPIERFLDDACRRVETWDIRGERRRVPFFDLGRHKVWGATAMILREFAIVWREALRADPAAGVGPPAAGESPALEPGRGAAPDARNEPRRRRPLAGGAAP